jgi:hypothetical protein
VNKNQFHTAHTTKRNLFGIAWLPLALCIVGASLEGASAAQTATLMLVGDAAPDGNGVFSDFGMQTLNAKGEVGFFCGFSGTQNPSTDGSGICLANTQSIKLLVRTGEPAPDGNGIFKSFTNHFDNFIQRVVLNDNGTVAFRASLTGTDGGTADDFGLFGASAGDGVKQFVRIPDAAPDGNGVFAETPPDGISLPEPPGLGLSTPGIDNSGRASFHGFLTDTSGEVGVDDTGAFRSDGNTITRLVRAGAVVPGGGDTFGLIHPELASNPGGQVAMRADIAYDFMSGPPREDLERIYVRTGTVLEEVVRSGISIPDGNGFLSGFQDFNINDNGNVLYHGLTAGVEWLW